MAQIVRRPRSDGGVTWQVKWRLGGTRDGAWQAESFTHEGRALAFKADVEDAGHHWPDGWIKGEGYVNAQPREPDPTFSDVRDAYWRAQERRVLRGRLKPHSLSRDKRTAALHLAAFDGLPFTDIDVEDIEAWVDRQLASGASPKSIRNRHGLLAAIMRHGAVAMRLRPDVPTTLTDLPSVDSRGRRQIRFLRRDEWGLLRSCLNPDVHLLVDTLLASGLRWGEASALQVGDVHVKGADEVVLHVHRAWSQRSAEDPAPVDTDAGETKAWKLGPTKTRRERFVAISGPVASALIRSIDGLSRHQFVFRGKLGGPWRYPDFHELRWAPARAEAMRRGLTKHPTVHMLRHTTVVWGLEAGVPLQALSEMLGHASISITFDTYGGFVDLHDATAARAIASQMASAVSAGEAP